MDSFSFLYIFDIFERNNIGITHVILCQVTLKSFYCDVVSTLTTLKKIQALYIRSSMMIKGIGIR